MKNKARHIKKDVKLKKGILLIFILFFLCGSSYMLYYFYNNYKEISDNTNILNKIDSIEIEKGENKRIAQLKELQKVNNEIIGWLEIEGTNINYPILQSKDNEFYLTHNYKKEKSSSGSLFLDKDFDLVNGSSNYLIYGHRSKQGLMFEDLLKYSNKDFYEEHKKIRFTTLKEDSIYEILSVFYSRVYYKKEKNVFRYYYFVNAENEEQYNEFIKEAKNASIYDTGVTATYGEQLLTLSTCEYSQVDGRFAVVCKRIK